MKKKNSLYNLHHITVIYGMQTNEVKKNITTTTATATQKHRHRGRMRNGIKKSATTVRKSAWTSTNKIDRRKIEPEMD